MASSDDHATRNAAVRARIEGDAGGLPAPGASLRVQVPTGAPSEAVAVPVSALRKGPTGDHVFVVAPDQAGKTRALPEVWTNKAKFDEAAQRLQTEVTKLGEVARAKNEAGVKAQFGAVGKACGGCHENFRSK